MYLTRRVRPLVAAVMMLCLSTYVIAQATCETRVQSIIDVVNSLCTTSERNRVCYGNVQVQAFPQPGVTDLNFHKPGDQAQVSLVKSLQLSPMNPTAGTWGIARMRLIPTTAKSADDDVILLLFGDVRIEDRSDGRFTFDFTVTSDYNINLRNFPALESTVIGWLEPGSMVTALGRVANGQWIRVQKQPSGLVGWVSAEVLKGDDLTLVTSLKVEGADEPYYGPMQAITFQGGSDTPSCEGAIPDGLLVQTPEGVARVTLLINEVTIDFVSTGRGSTAFIQTQPDGATSVSMLEGSAYVSTGENSQFVPPGAQIAIPNGSDGQPNVAGGRVTPNNPNNVGSLYGGLDRQPPPVVWTPSTTTPVTTNPTDNIDKPVIPVTTTTSPDGTTIVVLNPPPPGNTGGGTQVVNLPPANTGDGTEVVNVPPANNGGGGEVVSGGGGDTGGADTGGGDTGGGDTGGDDTGGGNGNGNGNGGSGGGNGNGGSGGGLLCGILALLGACH